MKFLKGQGGDTLVEVAMALAILAVTLVTSYNIASESYSEGMLAREHTQAIYLAQEQAEKLTLWRDTLIANPANLSTTPIMTTGNFPCVGGCHFNPGVAGLSPLGGPDNRIMFNGLSYRIEITGNIVGTSQAFQGTVRVTWDSLVADTNTTEIDIFLVDKRNILPRDCSLAGSQACV